MKTIEFRAGILSNGPEQPPLVLIKTLKPTKDGEAKTLQAYELECIALCSGLKQKFTSLFVGGGLFEDNKPIFMLDAELKTTKE